MSLKKHIVLTENLQNQIFANNGAISDENFEYGNPKLTVKVKKPRQQKWVRTKSRQAERSKNTDFSRRRPKFQRILFLAFSQKVA